MGGMKKGRGGPRPGAGRPKGARDKTPRAPERQQVAISAALLRIVRDVARQEGRTARAWVESAVMAAMKRAGYDTERILGLDEKNF